MFLQGFSLVHPKILSNCWVSPVPFSLKTNGTWVLAMVDLLLCLDAVVFDGLERGSWR